MNRTKILIGDCLESMKSLPEKCVQTCITSPPYFGLRSYMPGKVKLRDELTDDVKANIISELNEKGIYPKG